MTPEQVSALSDVELNRAMIWLYPREHMFWQDDNTGSCLEVEFDSIFMVDYLTDYNLTMPLAVENGLSVDLKHGTVLTDKLTHYSDKNPLRAICEAPVLIKCQ